MSVLLFAFKFHEVGCIQFVSDLSMFRSSKERYHSFNLRLLIIFIVLFIRSHQHNNYLDKNCFKIRIIQLQGFLSFANVGQLFDVITLSILQVDKSSQSNPLSFEKDDKHKIASNGFIATNREHRTNTLQQSHGYLQPADTSLTSDTLEVLHTALRERRNSLVSIVHLKFNITHFSHCFYY